MDSSSRRANGIIGATGGLIGVIALVTGSFVSFRPNRIVEGDPASALGALGSLGWVALGLWLLAAFSLILRWKGLPNRQFIRTAWSLGRGLLATCALVLLVVQSGSAASEFA
ncbi:MAG: hypothetical protein GX630_01695, partial [Actinobacteria bacterium]|nr:hypothetical protein [Actinomycetota bacterium]